jgi:hypothetical protein
MLKRKKTSRILPSCPDVFSARTLPARLTHTLSGPPSSPQQQAQEKAYEQCVTRHGFQDKYMYQPADRFWLFQAIESGIYILMSIILLTLTFWWTKYRIIG